MHDAKITVKIYFTIIAAKALSLLWGPVVPTFDSTATVIDLAPFPIL